MQIAAHHPDAVSEGSGVGMEEGLLLNGVTLHSGGVPPGCVECAAAVVANLADARLTFRNGAAMTTGETTDAVIAEMLIQRVVGGSDLLIEDVVKGRHRGTLKPILALEAGLGARL